MKAGQAYDDAVAAAQYQAFLAAQEAERAAALQATYARSAMRSRAAGDEVNIPYKLHQVMCTSNIHSVFDSMPIDAVIPHPQWLST